MIALNDLARHHAPLDSELQAAMARVHARGWYILGPEVEAFEREFASYVGAAECVAVANGTDALELAVRALDLGPAAEVATTANGGRYATAAIRAAGAVPAYVEIDAATLQMDPVALEAMLSPRTRAVIVTHLYGRMAEIGRLGDIARLRGVALIEDCAQAHGARTASGHAGTHGTFGCFSFYPTKNLGALGDAGAVVTGDRGLATRLRALRTYGWGAKYHCTMEGGMNSRMDELQAAALRAKLPYLDGWNRRRREIAARYAAAIRHPAVNLPPPVVGASGVVHLYVVRAKERESLRAHLAAAGVATDVHYPVPDHRQPGAGRVPSAGLAQTEQACAEVLSLPCYPELTDAKNRRGRDRVQSMATRYSLVVPVYRNEETIPDLLAALADVDRALGGGLEAVFVVDGSPDRSLDHLVESLPRTALKAKVIEMSRNFGAFAAIRAGLSEASGPYFAVMAADLQEPPELVVEFFRRLEQDECDVVCGVRAARDDPWQSRLASNLFWAAYRRLVQPEMPPGGVDVFGCNAAARDALVALTESHSSLIGQLLWIGMRRDEVPYHRRARQRGKSGWTLRKKITYMVDSSLAFSDLPIRLLFGVGMLALAVAVVYGGVVLVARLTNLIVEPGYAPTVLLISGFGALNALGLSVVGAYAWRAFENTKARPLAIVRRRFTFGEGP